MAGWILKSRAASAVVLPPFETIFLISACSELTVKKRFYLSILSLPSAHFIVIRENKAPLAIARTASAQAALYPLRLPYWFAASAFLGLFLFIVMIFGNFVAGKVGKHH